jgi:hypothetical protein
MLKKSLAGIFLLMLIGSTANAALVSRLSGAAYYDTVLDITWIANANLADTNDFGVTGINANGSMTWDKAVEWIAAMNTAAYLGKSDWRLPAVTDTGSPGCDWSDYGGTDCSYYPDLSTGEMAHLYYATLGNAGAYDTNNNETGCADGPSGCLTNTGPFSNLQPDYYWSGTTSAADAFEAWFFAFYDGYQAPGNRPLPQYAWAVRSGDIAAVPVPGAVWLMSGALGLLGLVRRKALTGTGA